MNLHPSSIAPQYNGHNFANLPATIQYWLTGQGMPALAPDVLGEYAQPYDLVLAFFIDSLGWDLFQKYADEYPFFRYLQKNGRISKITSQFPSTTAAHVTCIHTGLPVGQSGVYEWQYYEPKLDAVITPLLFSFAGTMERDQLKAANVDPKTLYPNETVYDSLAARGVKSHYFGPRPFTPSTFSEVIMRGAKIAPFLTLTEGLLDVSAHAKRATTPTYLFFYYGNIDTMCHHHGPHSIETHAEIETFAHAMEKWFLPHIQQLHKRALLVLFADHGHMSVTPQNTRYLNTDEALRAIVPMLRTDARGNVLVPAGSPRDAFLYVREECLDDAYVLLAKNLEGYADVVKTSDLLHAGYFGKLPVCADLLGRLGNLTVLPHPNNCVWWYQQKKFVQKYFGHHGGLTATEMEIPLALLDLST
jgi:predicted AlkP superfamily pyrophosphatase or phosphodiesterase